MHKRLYSTCRTLSVGITILFMASTSVLAGTYGPFTYTVNGTYIEITDCDASIKVAHLPELIEGLPVTDIATDAFKNCSSLNGILLPDSITHIKVDAFKNCAALTRAVYLGDLPTIESNAFPSVHSEFAHYTEWTPTSSTNGLPIIYFEGFADGFVLAGGEIMTYVGLGGALPIPSVVYAEGGPAL